MNEIDEYYKFTKNKYSKYSINSLKRQKRLLSLVLDTTLYNWRVDISLGIINYYLENKKVKK